jgi:hypothetical protein
VKVRPFRRFSDDDYPGAPTWFSDFLNTINPMVDGLNPLLANNIDIDNNLLAERQTVTLQHGVAIAIRLQRLKVIPRLVRVGYAAGYVGVGAITSYNTDGTFAVTVYFQGTAPTGPVQTTLVFEP